MLNSVNILNEYLRILINCSQLTKTYYNMLFGSFTQDHHAQRRIYEVSVDIQRITLNASCMTISGERTEQLDIFCRITGFTSGFLSFVDVELIRFFHGALELNFHSYCCNFVNNLFKKSCLLYSYLHLIIRLKKNEEIAYTAKSNVTVILLCCNICIDVCLTHLMSIT